MEDELHRAHAELDDAHWWFLGRRQVIEATLERHVRSGMASVLDVGCGAGGMLGVLKRFGDVVRAIEVEASAVRAARQRHPDVDVTLGLIPDDIAAMPQADLITAFDVLEHIDDDVAALRSMRNRMVDGGALCVTVPALPSLWSHHDELNHHRRRYTRRTLRQALVDGGFEVAHISYFNALLMPLVWTVRVAERLGRGPSEIGDFERTLGRGDRVLESVFALERFVVPRASIPLGVSLIAVGHGR